VASTLIPTPEPITTLLPTRVPLLGRRLLPLYPFHIGFPFFYLSGSAAANMYMPSASTLPRSTSDLLSPTSNITMSETSSSDAKRPPESLRLSYFHPNLQVLTGWSKLGRASLFQASLTTLRKRTRFVNSSELDSCSSYPTNNPQASFPAEIFHDPYA
jgi:hypothetical protein